MSKLAATTLAIGTVFAVGAVQAEPLTLTTDDMDQVTAAGTAFVDAMKNVDINEDIDKDVFITKFKDIRQRVDVFGYYADADGAANCFGDFFGCEVITYAIVDVNYQSNFATSVSGAEAATGFFGAPTDQ